MKFIFAFVKNYFDADLRRVKFKFASGSWYQCQKNIPHNDETAIISDLLLLGEPIIK